MKSAWADTIIASSAVSAIWHKGPLTQTSQCDAPGKPTCYTFTGSHAVAVTSADTELSLVPSRYVVYPGKASVTFTGSALPSMWGRHSMPFNTQRWTWTPDSAGTPTLYCANQPTCTITPQTSAIMTLTALVNGVEKSQSVHIRVLCAPTGDPLLDSLPFLDGLRAAEIASGDPDLPNQSDRREHFLILQCDSSGRCISSITELATPCGATPANPPPRLDVPDIVGSGHTHPFYPLLPAAGGGYVFRDSATVTLPDNCWLPGARPPTTRGSEPIPSAADYEFIQSYDQPGYPAPAPHYVLDPENIFAIPGGSLTPEARVNSTVTIPRGQGACRII